MLTTKVSNKNGSSSQQQDASVVTKDTEVLVHIGMPKTGTSAIQKFCMENNDWLLSQGYYYPAHDMDKNGISGGHTKIFHLLKKNDITGAKKAALSYLKKAKSKNKILLLSNEGAHTFYEEYLEIFAEVKLSAIGFYRDPVDNLFSAYNQMVKRHYYTQGLLEYTRKSITANKPILAGSTIIGWSKAFKDRFTALPYNKSISGKNSALYQFLAHLGLDEQQINQKIVAKKINAGYRTSHLELKRLINLSLSHDDHKLNNLMDVFFQAQADSHVDDDTTIEASIPTAMLKQLEDKFKPSVEEIQTLHGFKFTKPITSKNTLKFSAKQQLLEMIEAVNIMQDELPRLYKKIRHNVVSKEWYGVGADEAKLFDLFDVSRTDVVAFDAVFFESSVTKKLSDYKRVDFLRELAILFWRRGDIDNAYKLICEAKAIRPNGPVIKDLFQEIEEEFMRRNA